MVPLLVSVTKKSPDRLQGVSWPKKTVSVKESKVMRQPAAVFAGQALGMIRAASWRSC